MGIVLEKQYRHFLSDKGVGRNDKVADSVQSYISYLLSVSNKLKLEISPESLNSEQDIDQIRKKLDGKVSLGTLRNFTSAMRQYVSMVNETHGDHSSDSEEEKQLNEEHLVHQHTINSSFREKLLEHIFIAELLKRSWLEGTCSMEIAKPEVDSRGYDLIAEANGVVRHIQLKSTKVGGSASYQKVHIDLANKPSGCVVWLFFNEKTLELNSYLFFGGKPKEPLPSLEGMAVAKHTKGNASGEKLERPLIRKVKKGDFESLSHFDTLYKRLFG